MSRNLKILHTADWHLGRTLYGRKRYEEFSKFLDWLACTIEQEHIDILLLAGDVFDTSIPGNRALELYYRFLSNIDSSCCRHIVVIAGNHDSPSYLEASKELLRILHVYVVGAITEKTEDEVIVLKDRDNYPEAIICAVPYLRDRDIRHAEPGESIEDKNTKLIEGIKNHYDAVCAIAEQKQADFEHDGYPRLPIIAMGHLFSSGGKTVDGDGVRELYVGSLAHVSKDIFPVSIDYLALGHLHIAQCVGTAEHIRYSGSPIPMGFGEAGQSKKVIILEFSSSRRPLIRELPIPCFQALERIAASLKDILARIAQLKKEKSNAWLEIEYTGLENIDSLRRQLEDAVSNTSMEIRRIKNKGITNHIISSAHSEETLNELNEHDVFKRYLDTIDMPAGDRGELIRSYNEIIQTLREEDSNAE